MKTVPNANPPRHKCHSIGIANIGLVLLPIELNRNTVATAPTTTLIMIRQEPVPVKIRMNAPIKAHKTEVSPIDPGIIP